MQLIIFFETIQLFLFTYLLCNVPATSFYYSSPFTICAVDCILRCFFLSLLSYVIFLTINEQGLFFLVSCITNMLNNRPLM